MVNCGCSVIYDNKGEADEAENDTTADITHIKQEDIIIHALRGTIHM